METLQLVEGLFGGGALAVLLVQASKDLLNKINERYGALSVQLLLLVVSVVVGAAGMYVQYLPQNILVAAGSIFASAMAIYEVLYKGLWQQAIKGQV